MRKINMTATLEQMVGIGKIGGNLKTKETDIVQLGTH